MGEARPQHHYLRRSVLPPATTTLRVNLLRTCSTSVVAELHTVRFDMAAVRSRSTHVKQAHGLDDVKCC